MTKKVKNTFAERARKIQNKYKRADFDPIEQASMEAELESLMKEQESFRNAMGLNQEQQQFGYGGNTKPIHWKTPPEFVDDLLGRSPNGTTFGGGRFGGGGSGREWDDTQDKMIQKKWLDHRYPVGPTFDQAWGEANKKGLKDFTFDGKKFTTEKDTTGNWNRDHAMRTEAVLRMVTDENNKIIDDSTRVEPFLGIPPVLEIPAGTPNQKYGYGGKLKMDGTETTQFIPEPQYPSWMPEWASSSLDFLGKVDRLGMPYQPLITGIAPFPGRGFRGGFKNLPINIKLPKQSFVKPPLAKGSRAVEGINPGKSIVGRESMPYNSAQVKNNVQVKWGSNKPTVNTPPPANPIPPTNPVPPVNPTAGVVPPRPVGYFDDITNGVANGIDMSFRPSYAAMGIGAGLGMLGAGIYGLTQLPDGRVVDKQGKPVTKEQVAAMSGVNPSVSQLAGFQPTEEWLNSIGWNSKIPTEQAVKDKVPTKDKGKDTQTKQQSSEQAVVIPQAPAVSATTAPSGWGSVVDNISNFGMMAAPQPQASGSPASTTQSPTLSSTRATQVMDNLQKELSPDASRKDKKDRDWKNLPYALSGLSNIAGNLLLANMAKKVPQAQPAMAVPQKINLEPKANILREQADVSKNINMMNARNLGVNPGAMLGSMGVMNSGVDRGLSEALTNLYMGQETANVGAANQFALQNQDATNRANLYNAGMKYQGLQDKLGYMGAALGTIPGVMKDVRMDKADKEMRSIMDAYYKSSGGKNYLAEGSIFDTEFGKYIVKGHNPDGTPITEKVKK